MTVESATVQPVKQTFTHATYTAQLATADPFYATMWERKQEPLPKQVCGKPRGWPEIGLSKLHCALGVHCSSHPSAGLTIANSAKHSGSINLRRTPRQVQAAADMLLWRGRALVLAARRGRNVQLLLGWHRR
jgi:hypothetical protein